MIHTVWQKNGIDVTDEDNYKIFSKGNKHTLEFSNLNVQNKGTYSCKVTNDCGTDICYSDLIVLDKPSFTRRLEPTQTVINTGARLECQVNDDTSVTISWKKDGLDLHSSKYYKITFEDKIAVMEILKARLKDEGNYLCTASNEAGSDSCSALLTVKGKECCKSLAVF